MGLFSNLADTVGVARNSFQGEPTLEQPADQDGGLFDTLQRYSGLADEALNVYDSLQNGDGNGLPKPSGSPTPTSQPKGPGSAAVSGGLNPQVLILAALAAVGWFLVTRK